MTDRELIAATCARIVDVDRAAAARTQTALDNKTKPRRSLGRLEDVACAVAAIRGGAPSVGAKAIVVMAADHGVAVEGTSAYPQEVTAQMLLNFARGGAAINVLARHAGARVVVVDMGTRGPAPSSPEIRAARVADGTRNFTRGPAMSREEAERAVAAGIAVAAELTDGGVTLLGIGDMGIGNTTASSALTCAFTGAPPEEVTGRGTGIDDAGYARKLDAVRRGLAVNHLDGGADARLDGHDPRARDRDPIATLAAVGGFEIGGLAGVVLGAAAARVPVVMDGFISSVAALVAARVAPRAADYLLPSHRSVEVGHRLVLQALGKRPLFDLDMRLGEGTGAALAMQLVDASLRILDEMATFASAGVSDSGA
jgi:nicotinate-nucleotide--dimethylbenzimidazole phosphoribosyltransferase